MPRTDPSAAPMLIKNIADKIQQDQVTFVVGAGMSTLANTINGEPFPSSVGLATSLATHFHLRLAPPDKTNLAYVAQVVETEHGRDALHTWLEHQLSFDPNAIPREHKVLMKLATRVVTTNYDTLLDEAARALAPTKTFRVIRRPVDCSSLDGPILIKARLHHGEGVRCHHDDRLSEPALPRDHFGYSTKAPLRCQRSCAAGLWRTGHRFLVEAQPDSRGSRPLCASARRRDELSKPSQSVS